MKSLLKLLGLNRAPAISSVFAPVDPWKQFASELPAKLDWARSVNVKKIALDASSTPETVERVSGYPTLWLEFGAIVQAPEKLSLQVVNRLGRKILNGVGEESELLWSWYKAYMNSVTGRGPISMEEYQYLSRDEIWALDKAIDVGTHVRKHLREITSFSDYLAVTSCVPNAYWHHSEFGRDRAEEFNHRKESLLAEAKSGCKSTEDLLKLYRSTEACPDGAGRPYWMCACNTRSDIGHEIYQRIEAQIKGAATSEQAEKICVPGWIGRSDKPNLLTALLESEKKQMLSRLKTREEECRIRSALKD